MSSEVETSRVATFKVSSRDSSTSLAMTKVAEKIIVALDVPTKTRALDLVRQLRQDISFFKVGLQLYNGECPEIVHAIRATGAKVFLDLKLHDIPNTVAKAVESTTDLGVQILTLHLSGSSDTIPSSIPSP